MSGDYDGSNSPKLRKKSFLKQDEKQDEQTDREIIDSLMFIRKEKNVSPFIPTLVDEKIEVIDPLIDRFNVKNDSITVKNNKESPIYSPIEDLTYPSISRECINYLTSLSFNNIFVSAKNSSLENQFANDIYSGKWSQFNDGRNFYPYEKKMITETDGWVFSLGVDFLGFLLDSKMDLIYTQKINTHNYIVCERTKTFTTQVMDLNDMNSKLWIQFKVYFVVVYNPLKREIETLCLFIDEIRYVSTNYLYDKLPFTTEFIQNSISICLSNILHEIRTKLNTKLITVVEDLPTLNRMKKERKHEVISANEFENRYSGYCTLSELIELPEEILLEDSILNFYQYGSSRMVYLLKQTILHFKNKL